jgi:hypothetical protein
MHKISTLITMGLLFIASCQMPLSPGDKTSLVRWTQRLEAVASDIALLSDSPETKQWGTTASELLKGIRVGIETGELQTVVGLLDKVRALKPLLVESLKAKGVEMTTILAILSSLDLILIGIEESV